MLRRLCLLISLLPVLAFAEQFVAGQDYELISDGQHTAKQQKTTVTEFFSYGCPWCYRIEPALNEWKKQNQSNITFHRVPVIFHKEWTYYAKAFYTAQLLGISDKMDALLFKTIQTDKKPLTSNQDMIDFFISQGVNKDVADSAFTHSTTIDLNVSEGNSLMGRFRINAVPAIVINGRYKTDLQMAKGEERLFKIMTFLLTLNEKQ